MEPALSDDRTSSSLLVTSARQKQTMTPRLQQAVRLLLLSAQDYEKELREMALRNPFLDIEESVTQAQSSGGTAPGSPTGQEPAFTAEPPQASEEMRNDWAIDEPVMMTGTTDPRDGSDTRSAVSLAEAEVSLREKLHAQAANLPLSDRDRAIVGCIVESLEDDGYLRCTLSDISQWLSLTPAVADTELVTALRLVQSFEPTGVAARNLVECLLLQVNAKRPAWPTSVAGLIQHHLPQLARGELRSVARLHDLSMPELQHAWSLIRQLDPRPGAHFDRPRIEYLRPDVTAFRENGHWKVRSHPAAHPRISLNHRYVDLFQRHCNAGHTELAAHLREARWTLRHVRQRGETILAVAQAIVQRQQAYLDHGALAMRPLALRDIAQELGIHESTVSRVTNNKYLETPNGLVELKHFFSRPMQLDSGGASSATAIRGLVLEIITTESPADPLSDVQIAERLTRQGLQVARRTVTKYRQMLKFPPVERRRAPLAVTGPMNSADSRG